MSPQPNPQIWAVIEQRPKIRGIDLEVLAAPGWRRARRVPTPVDVHQRPARLERLEPGPGRLGARAAVHEHDLRSAPPAPDDDLVHIGVARQRLLLADPRRC